MRFGAMSVALSLAIVSSAEAKPQKNSDPYRDFRIAIIGRDGEAVFQKTKRCERALTSDRVCAKDITRCSTRTLALCAEAYRAQAQFRRDPDMAARKKSAENAVAFYILLTTRKDVDDKTAKAYAATARGLIRQFCVGPRSELKAAGCK